MEKFMKRSIIMAAALSAAATSAEAACSKASLNGNWTLTLGGSGTTATIANGQATLPGPLIFKILSFNSACVGFGSVTAGATTIFTTISSESVPASSPAKPNFLTFHIQASPVVYQVYTFTRR